MRLLRFEMSGSTRVGLEVSGHVVALDDLLALDGPVGGVQRVNPSTLEDLLADPPTLALAGQLSTHLDDDPAAVARLVELGKAVTLADALLLPPIARPEKIVGVALNFVSHANEAERELPTYPTLFMKPVTTITGPAGPITVPRATHRIDYEGELAIVVGRTCRYVAEEDALQYVAGYTVGNDVSARDYQFRTNQIMQGKAFDGFLPLGPWVTTRDEIPDVGKLTLTTHVNGDLRQQAQLDEMVFSVPHLVSYVSNIMTLTTGDIILAGTPGGIGAAMTPRRWLRPDDTVRVEISGLGVQNCTVELEQSAETQDDGVDLERTP